MKKILFPTDFSQAAKSAFEYALALAADMNARVEVAHIYQIPIGDLGSLPPDYLQQLMEEAEASAQERLDAFVQPYLSHAALGARELVYGLFTAVEITDLAKKKEAGLVVMGTKGERSALEKFLGSITTEVMMQAPCPVLAIPEDARYGGVHDIAYATAFDPADEHAVDQLMDLGKSLGARVHFVHVNTKSDEGNIQDIETVKSYPYHFTDFAVLNNYSVLDGIDRYLNERKTDWLALFIPHRRLWERLFHSSFTKKMTFHTHIPLLVFHG